MKTKITFQKNALRTGRQFLIPCVNGIPLPCQRADIKQGMEDGVFITRLIVEMILLDGVIFEESDDLEQQDEEFYKYNLGE